MRGVSHMYEEKLKELGFALPQAAAPVANYVPAVVEDGWIYVSGQLPMVNGALAFHGQVGREVSVEQGYRAAQVCALNCLGAVKQALGSLERIQQIVKISGFVNSAPGFTDQPKVVNGASDLLGGIFGSCGTHARSAVGVAALPLGACCEVELIAKVKT